MGAVIFPPVPAFYTQPQSIEDLVEHTVMRVLDQFGLHTASAKRWQGVLSTTGTAARKAVKHRVNRRRRAP
jgi:4-hydroxy-3-polyprenylbenzoate decarboxylase